MSLSKLPKSLSLPSPPLIAEPPTITHQSAIGRYEQRLSHVEVHVSDANGGKAGTDKRVSLEVRPAGHAPIAVHADAHRVETAVTAAVHKIERALAHAIGKQKDSKGH